MCGINVIYNQDEILDQHKEIVLKMNKEMLYRGPDAQEIWNDDNVVFGHVRLSIIGLENGSQPLFSTDKNLVLICNGEIYNYVELKEQLKNDGAQFQTESDCETILFLYQKYGLDFIHHLRGMFAIVLWDKSKEELIIARDRMGKKPLYFASTLNGVVISSEMKAIAKCFLSNYSLNHKEIINSLKYSHPLLEKETFINEIEKVEPGQLIVFHKDSIKKCTYWSNKSFVRKKTETRQNALKQTREILQESVAIRLRSDVPVAVLLSSGIDSTSVASLAKECREEVHAITVGYKAAGNNDERQFAKKFAKEKGIIYHEVELDQKDFKNYFEEYTATFDEPVCDIAAIAQWGIYKKAKELGFKVLLSGIGGDELFYGYPIHNKLGESITATLNLKQFFPLNSTKGYLALLKYIYQQKQLLNFNSKNSPESHFKRYYQEDFEKFKKSVLESKLDFSLEEQLNLSNSKKNGVDTVYQYLLNEWLINNCFYQTDRLGMGNSVEVRAPFADQKLIEYVLQLPFEVLFDLNRPKGFLKDVMKNDLPAYILNMPKKGFTPPMGYIKEIEANYNSKYFDTELFHYNQVLVDTIISSHYTKYE